MKKKIKLFSTIASLCLAVALMAFGVYAAVQQNYTITNTVVYNITHNTLVKVTRVVEKLDTGTTEIPGETLSTLTYTASSIADYTAQTYDDDSHLFNSTNLAGDSVTFDFTEAFAYKVTITIETVNSGGCEYSIDYSGLTTAAGNATNNFKFTPGNPDPDGDEFQDELTFIYYIAVADVTKPIPNATTGVQVIDAITITLEGK